MPARTLLLASASPARLRLLRDAGFDPTLNHQLWFAAAGALLAPHADPEVGERVMCFLDCLDANLAVDASGLVRQPIAPWRVLHGDLRLGARLWLVARRDRERAKERGYLGFNLYALALLRRHTPEDRVWQLTRVTRALALARSPHFREALADNPFGWGYNPSGIEIPFALEIFAGPASRGEQGEWLTEQLRRHWDPELCALSRATSDPATLAARIYEATRLADLQIPDAVASAARRNSEGPA